MRAKSATPFISGATYSLLLGVFQHYSSVGLVVGVQIGLGPFPRLRDNVKAGVWCRASRWQRKPSIGDVPFPRLPGAFPFVVLWALGVVELTPRAPSSFLVVFSLPAPAPGSGFGSPCLLFFCLDISVAGGGAGGAKDDKKDGKAGRKRHWGIAGVTRHWNWKLSGAVLRTRLGGICNAVEEALS